MAKKEKIICSCKDCIFAYLMRSLECNPVVSECQKTGERQVASTTHCCDFFKQRDINKQVIINKMKFV